MMKLAEVARLTPSERHVRRCVEVVLTVACAVSCAALFWHLVPAPQGPELERRELSAVRMAPHLGPPLVDAERLALARSVFGGGRGRQAGASGGALAQPSRETSLDLRLKGVLAHREIDKQLALIAKRGQPEDVYARGDVIAGAKILRIEARRVILRHNGVTESLSLEVEKLERIGEALAAESAHSNGIIRSSDFSHTVSRELFDQQIKTLGELISQAKAVPHLEGGQPAGLRVTQVQAGSLFEDLGLRQQDVIRSVNGSPVRNARDAMQAYEAFRSSSSYAIGVLRDGRELTLDYSIQ